MQQDGQHRSDGHFGRQTIGEQRTDCRVGPVGIAASLQRDDHASAYCSSGQSLLPSHARCLEIGACCLQAIDDWFAQRAKTRLSEQSRVEVPRTLLDCPVRTGTASRGRQDSGPPLAQKSHGTSARHAPRWPPAGLSRPCRPGSCLNALEWRCCGLARTWAPISPHCAAAGQLTRYSCRVLAAICISAALQRTLPPSALQPPRELQACRPTGSVAQRTREHI